MIAYAAIMAMAVVPILIGSYRSIPSSKKDKNKEVMSSKDAWLAPVVGSAVLFLLYVLVKYVSKEVINILITGYVIFFGSICIIQLITPEVRLLLQRLLGIELEKITTATSSETSTSSDFNSHGANATNEEDKNVVPTGSVNKVGPGSSPYGGINTILSPISIKLKIRKTSIFSMQFDFLDILSVILVSIFAAYYLASKNWIASNIYAEAICFGAISLIHLDSFITGVVLLSGLFLYDIFWVFGTDVMITVAQSFDAPLLVRFPRNIFAVSSPPAMLGLGDIVVPGTFP